MAGCAQRDSVPAKIELEDNNGIRHTPEKIDISLLSELPDAERGALFALSQWCGGTLSSFLQLDLRQTSELLKMLDDCACFFPANQPEKPIPWADGGLTGVSDYLPQENQKINYPVGEAIEEEENSIETTLGSRNVPQAGFIYSRRAEQNEGFKIREGCG